MKDRGSRKMCFFSKNNWLYLVTQGRLHHINLGANAPRKNKGEGFWEVRGKLNIIILHA